MMMMMKMKMVTMEAMAAVIKSVKMGRREFEQIKVYDYFSLFFGAVCVCVCVKDVYVNVPIFLSFYLSFNLSIFLFVNLSIFHINMTFFLYSVVFTCFYFLRSKVDR